ncbi:hypothetical protein PCH_Pc12g09460 [Penicillium rubens Wisconsin 54-1255]|uniref:Uncharacterized protein n=1 Tax=Penicillium rubens (strain ATCC 28089 / DSM 1075 / NRRL 1951 / Wisconsin 54-1255) TaxID=500485 RepID=B6GZH4_PENRW|nr:hypothetical protein PCH_Pc12g09460 [Penicillium rubens Wisconsin 54-1255]
MAKMRGLIPHWLAGGTERKAISRPGIRDRVKDWSFGTQGKRARRSATGLQLGLAHRYIPVPSRDHLFDRRAIVTSVLEDVTGISDNIGLGYISYRSVLPYIIKYGVMNIQRRISGSVAIRIVHASGYRRPEASV